MKSGASKPDDPEMKINKNLQKFEEIFKTRASHRAAGTHFVLADLHWLILFCLFCSESLFALAYYVPDNSELWHILY